MIFLFLHKVIWGGGLAGQKFGYKGVIFLERAEVFYTVFRIFFYCGVALYRSLVQVTSNDSPKFILAKLTGNGILCE